MKTFVTVLLILITLASCQNRVARFNPGDFEFNTLLMVEADPGKGFHWPYLIRIPEHIQNTDRKIHFLVYPNNTGGTNDSFNKHKNSAIRKMSYRFTPFKDQEMGFIALCPVFPRFSKKLGGWKNYTHALDRDTLLCDAEVLKRIDLQLIKMLEDAAGKIETAINIEIEPEIFMFGFSASAHFVDRFSLLHPELVKACAIGGFNGHLMLPLDEIDGTKLIYPVGVCDYKEITGREFNPDAHNKIEKFIYLGETDTNDDVPYDDGYDDPERFAIYKVFGELEQGSPTAARIPKIEVLFNRYNYFDHYQLRIYRNTGHILNDEMFHDVKDFYLSVLEKKEH